MTKRVTFTEPPAPGVRLGQAIGDRPLLARFVLWLLRVRIVEGEDEVAIHLPRWMGERSRQRIADRLAKDIAHGH